MGPARPSACLLLVGASMKKVFLLLFLSSLFIESGFAQDIPNEEAVNEETVNEETVDEESTTSAPESASRSVSNWAAGLSIMQWNETLKIQQGVTNDKDIANYNALTLSLQKEVTHYHWGWNANAFLGSGQAVGGGNSNLIPYQKDKVAFTVFGISPRIFYRLSGRINAGLTAIAFMKNVDWPKDSTTQTIDSGRKLNITALADLNIRLLKHWDFYTAMGPVTEGTTLWKLGLSYRY